MKILFIVDDTLFFLPKWFEEVYLTLKKDHKIIALTPLVTKTPTLYSYIIKNLPRLGFQQFLKLLFTFLSLKLKEFLFEIQVSNKPINLHQIAKKYRINILTTQNVNSSKYLKKVTNKKPDIIFSSCSQIFKKEILSIPAKGCINRHSALLPSYGGLFPIFQSMIKKEKQTGITIHYMTTQIDKGKVIYQSSINIKKTDTLFELYKKAYKESTIASIRAIKIIEEKLTPVVVKKCQSSYYSFPNSKDWETFWKLKLKFI